MSADPHVYVNSTVTVNAGPEYLTATSANPLAVFQYYIPNASADLHVNLAAVPVTSYSKHAGLARQDLGASPFNVMAVDTEGNMSYSTFSGAVPVLAVADSYTVSAGTTRHCRARRARQRHQSERQHAHRAGGRQRPAWHPGPLHQRRLQLHSHHGLCGHRHLYLHGQRWRFERPTGVSDPDRHRGADDPPTTPLPSSGETAAAVNTALDWADVSGATSYDVYLWVTAQTKPATATANVTASSYVPPAILVGVTNYSWQVVANNQSGSVSGPAWTFTTAAQATDPANLISVDFVYGESGSVACSGDTVLTGTLKNNAAGQIFTGQTGAWNALQVGATGNANTSSASLGSLKNGVGTATTVSFKMGTATSAGASGGGWRTNYFGAYVTGSLRQEQAYLYYPTLTSNHYNWELTGLTPNAHYRMTQFCSGGSSYTNIANSVAGVLDAEGDWNWTDIPASATGVITGNLLTTGNDDVQGLYGLQLYKQAASAALAANAGTDQTGTPATIGGSPAATGGTAPYTYSWSPSTGLASATAANPTASPASTTSYTLTVTDFLGATATDSVIVTVNGAPAPTTTTLTSSPAATGPYGTAVTFTATVSPAASGTVTFYDGATVLGTGTLASGQATFTTSAGALAMGGHSITASYGGDAALNPASPPR